MYRLAFLLGAACVACGSGNPTEGGPSPLNPDGGPDKPKARAIVTTSYEGDAGCGGSPVTLGAFDPAPAPVDDGANVTTGVARVHCRVIAGAAGTFTVEAKAEAGDIGFEVKGTLSGAPESNSSVVASWMTRNTASGRACTATYSKPQMGIALGRVWLSVTCLSSENLPPPSSCKFFAEARFENCLQE